MDRSLRQLSQEARFQLFLDSACDYAIFFTLPNGDICEWSSGAEKIIGFSEAEALQLNGRAIFTPEDQASGVPEKEMDAARREGQANDERWHVRKDGSRFFAVGRLVGLHDKSGSLCGFAKILRDATRSKLTEEALRATETQLRAVVSQAPWGIALLNLDARFDHVNDAFCQICGVTADRLRGRHLVHVTHPDDQPRIRAAHERCFSDPAGTTTMEKRILRPDGSILWVQNSITVLRDSENRPTAVLDLCQDITPMKKSEEELNHRVAERTAALLDKTAQMEAFCYTVAHDLRAPLRAVSGYADFLQAEYGNVPESEAREYLRRIHASAGKLDELIKDLLSYTRIQQVAVALEDVDLDRVVKSALQQLDSATSKPHIRVESPLGRIRGDSVALEHVFTNLLSNAAKFIRPDSPADIRIYSEHKENHIRIWVEDNGIGIDPRYKDRAFMIFERLHPQLGIPGTGVGLAIVAKAMERLSGSYGVEPNQPHGSRFWIEIPK